MPVWEHLERGQASRYMRRSSSREREEEVVVEVEEEYQQQQQAARAAAPPVKSPGSQAQTESRPEPTSKRRIGKEGKTKKREKEGYQPALLPGLDQPI